MNNGEPQSPQEPRTAIEAPWGEGGEVRILIGGSEGVVGVRKRREGLGKRPKARKGAPEALRQVVQWQMVRVVGRVVLWKVTWPQRQVPLRAGKGVGGMFRGKWEGFLVGERWSIPPPYFSLRKVHEDTQSDRDQDLRI